MSLATELNVSLEPHLAEALQPLVKLLPQPLNLQLENALNAVAISQPRETEAEGNGQAVSIISYSLLTSISAWARSSEARAVLSTCSPPLFPSDYTMVALLAGTRTSPEKKFPATFAPLTGSGAAEARRELGDRRAVTAVFNALLSILGAGFATWWAADRLAWRDEWRVLLALLVAIVVAASEAGLYLIWDSRRSKPLGRKRRRNTSVTVLAEESSSTDTIASIAHETKELSKTGTPVQISTELIRDFRQAPENVQVHRTADNLRARVHPKGTI